MRGLCLWARRRLGSSWHRAPRSVQPRRVCKGTCLGHSCLLSTTLSFSRRSNGDAQWERLPSESRLSRRIGRLKPWQFGLDLQPSANLRDSSLSVAFRAGSHCEKPTESVASEQTTTESNARFSRTHCDVQERSDVGCVVMRPNRMRTYPKALKEFNAHDCHPAISATS